MPSLSKENLGVEKHRNREESTRAGKAWYDTYMPPKIPSPRCWKNIIAFSLAVALFWFLEFAYQYYRLIPGDLGLSLVRSFALTAATFIGFALFLSAIFKWFGRTARYWRLRRYSGVAGFLFAFFHVWSVYHFLYNYNIGKIYFSLNPFINPIIFGSLAFPILFLMAVSSTDWAVRKLTPHVWKNLHRFVYVAYWGIVFHMSFLSADLLNNIAGYVLLLITSLALFGELYWYIRIAGKKRFRSLGTLIGALIILLYLGTAYLAYSYKTGVRETAKNLQR